MVLDVVHVPSERRGGDRGKRKHRYGGHRWRGQQLKTLLYADRLVWLMATGVRTGIHRRFDKRPRRGRMVMSMARHRVHVVRCTGCLTDSRGDRTASNHRDQGERPEVPSHHIASIAIPRGPDPEEFLNRS
jgi:hypothetical protein